MWDPHAEVKAHELGHKRIFLFCLAKDGVKHIIGKVVEEGRGEHLKLKLKLKKRDLEFFLSPVFF